MPAPASRRLTALVVALAMSSAALVSVSAAATATPIGSVAAAGSSGTAGGCRVPLLDRATRGSAVKAASGDDLAAAARVNGVKVDQLSAQVSRDRTLWLDACGRAFHVEPAGVSGPAEAAGGDGTVVEEQASTATDPGPLSAALMLESKPGSSKTIYLDFNGGTVTGTGWNDNYTAGAAITAAPYSITEPADTSFTDAELTEIQKAWQIVAEDFAPFDVNVTTKTPAAGAIERSGPADTMYGTRVLMTAGGPIYNDCGCSGVAYVGTFSLTDNAYYQPAWVFTDGARSTAGKRMGEIASHEAGHNLGLDHDGTASTTYYSGAAPWAPIMGTGSGQPVSQWSAGEYPGATNTENDLAIIATHLPVRADDHANTALEATPLTATPTEGAIATRADTWVGTFEDYDLSGLSYDPRLGHVLQGAGAPSTMIENTFTDGDGYATWAYELTLQPGQTKSIVNFAVMRASKAEAAAAAGTIAANTPYSCMTHTEANQVANFVVGDRPTLTLPGNLQRDATGPTGANVTFSATAVDGNNQSVPVTCTPASGSVFAVGTTTVTCTATDAQGRKSTGTFTVTVRVVPECDGEKATIEAKPGVITMGTSGKDVIVGTSAADTINSLGGNDVICGVDGSDVIDSGSGDDLVFGGDGDDKVVAGRDNDEVHGDTGDDIIKGGRGRDKVTGDAGNDTIRGGADNDRLSGNGGNDRVVGSTGNDNVSGGGGKDQLNGNRGDDKVTSGGGADQARGGPGQDVVDGVRG